MPRFRGNQVLVFCPVGTNNYKYGFKQNEQKFNAYGGELGLALASGEVGVFYGANSPKPPRARKKFTDGTVSSFFDNAKRRTLASSGWTLSNGDAAQGIRTDGLAVTVAVNTPHNYQYAWNITRTERQLALSLGAIVPTDPDRLVWGSFPKPPRARRKDADGSKSTFIPPDLQAISSAIAAGWSVEAPDPDWNLA